LWNRLSSQDTAQGALFPVDGVPWLTVSERAAVDYRRRAQMVATLERAVRDRVLIQARYRALSTRQITSRTIEPGQIHHDRALDTLYLIGWCRLRKDIRIFAVHRFIAVNALDERCPPRSETRSQAVLQHAFRVWRSNQIDTVRIWFAPDAAEEVRERRWLPSQSIAEASDGSIVLEAQVAGLAEVERWVLGYGPSARALAPSSLVESIRDRLRAAAASYDDAESPAPAVSLSLAGKGRR
jgi:proteasome accessory factor B